MSSSLSLFELSEGDALADRLQSHFEAWLRSAPGRGPGTSGTLRDESARIYAEMWQAFIAFCAPAGKTGRTVRLDPLADLGRQDLLDFLDHAASRPLRKIRTGQDVAALTPRYAWRVLQLIDRVINHAREALGREPLEAAAELMLEEPYRYANATSQTPVPDVLDDAQADALVARLTADLAVDTARGISWKVLRDRTAVALMLGAGLAPGQARGLRLADVACAADTGLPWRLTVAADGSTPEHQVPIAPWAAALLKAWLDVRPQWIRVEADAGWIFPSTTLGKPWSHPACHRSAVAVLDEAGVEGGTPFRLRHTFAVRQLRRGHAEEEVARWMGYTDTAPMRRYRHLLTRPVGDLA